jgi:hypothetical protein
VAAKPEPDPLEVRLLYSPHVPEPPQHAFLLLDDFDVEEALYGGAAGGGKSDALLMAALKYVDVPGYAAILFRRTFTDLALPGALMDRGKEWLAGTEARWTENLYRFKFPSGASLTFAYLAHSTQKYRYQGAEFQFVGFDELTQFPEADYRYLFSRLRKPSLVDERTGKPLDLDPEERRKREVLATVPLRMRVASNPGGLGHEWVRRRFIERLPDPDDPEDTVERAQRRVFIPARLEDNPHVDQESYERSLSALDAVERARLRNGDWYVDDGTRTFNGDHLLAALDAGRNLDALAERGEAPPPKGALLELGLDFGEHTAYVYAWPLERGGLWIVAADEIVGREPGDSTDEVLEALKDVPAWDGLGLVKQPLDLVEEARYDSAGVQSMRTFTAKARRRSPKLKTESIPFNSYKRETVGYLRHLVQRVGEGKETRILAISENAKPLYEAMKKLVKDPKDPELWVKEADHLPDALVAVTAPIARRNRPRQ